MMTSHEPTRGKRRSRRPGTSAAVPSRWAFESAVLLWRNCVHRPRTICVTCIAEGLDAARRAEREANIVAVCRWCREGTPLQYRPETGDWWHSSLSMIGSWRCDAGALRRTGDETEPTDPGRL